MASRINLGELKLMEIKSFCEKLVLSTKGNKLKLSAVLPSEIAPELYYEKVESTKGGGNEANEANNNNEEQVGEMAFANAANNNNEEQSEEEDEDVFGNELKFVETVDRGGVQPPGNGVHFQEPAFNRVLQPSAFNRVLQPSVFNQVLQPLAFNVVQLPTYWPNRVATLREWNRRCKIYVSKMWTVFASQK
ncbi:uncharacterized protein LOC121467667 [Drosophila elegans]|uniref:uncharacterized protein LOC121467667 n=1 Tax=Drosophila elegans TaxID=30023 RepID=UPI001BC860F7|nr:uncharacterized protein LOC121467667 [Drosophila elegans]